ncbi:DUF4328 domain-containing protein [Streptosporangium sp. CA-135522]|uniref:DUF4328 domain-containing protein n=1 Tax=Streptosporangium sp. CA-135522 TaxID=3240072 RepID=UPI003D8ACAE3
MAVYVSLSAQVTAVAALVVFEQVRGRRLAGEISALGGDPHASGAQALVGAVTVFAVLMLLVVATTITAAATYLTWLVQARRSAAPGAGAAPALAGWFLPAVNLVAPPMLVHRLWRACRPPANRRARWVALLTAWWLSWLATLALILVRLPLDTAPGDTDLTGLGPTELAAVATSALLCAATVRWITRIQTAGARHHRRAQAVPVASQGAPQVLTRQVSAR